MYKGVDLLFERVEVDTYQRGQDNKDRTAGNYFPRGRASGRRAKKFSGIRALNVAGHLVLLAVAFLLGRAVLLGELLPFGAALVAPAFVIYREYAPSALLGAAFGLITVTSGWDQVIHILALAAVGAAALALPPRAAALRLLLGGAVFAVLVVAGTGYAAATDPTTYDYIRVLFEAVFAALLTTAYYGALKGLRKAARRGKISGEELFCLALLLVSVVAGAGQVQLSGISPGGVLSGLVVMTAGYIGRAGFGAAAGAVMGALPGLIFTVSPAAMGALAFAGFLGGLCRGLGRMGVVAGFLLGNILLTVYLGNSRDILRMLFESAGAALVFLLLPRAVLAYFQSFFPVLVPWVATDYPDNGGSKINVPGRLSGWGNAFEEISCAYDQIGGAMEPESGDQGWHATVNELKNMVCAGCALYRVCWEREAQQTFRCLYATFDVAETKERIGAEDLDDGLRLRCCRAGELVVGINCLNQLRRMNRFWESRLRESRELVSDQLRGMRDVIDHLGRRMESESETWRGRAEYFKQELKQAGFPVVSVIACPGPRDFEVEITMPACGGSRRCRYDVAPLLSRLAGVNLAPAMGDCVCFDDEEFCTFRLYPNLRHRLEVGLACAAGRGNAVSGDGYAVLPLSNGQVVLMLSDGMGSGSTAAAASRAVLSLLRQLLKTGFNKNLAVRILNSVMIRQFNDDNFATVDMCVVDLYSGRAELIKIGASPSFHVRQSRVDVIGAGSLPAGIMDEISVFTVSRDFVAGDILVMVTDGVTDVYRGAEEKEEWITTVLREIVDLPAREVADLILRLAQSGAGDRKNADDMTVLVARVEKSN